MVRIRTASCALSKGLQSKPAKYRCYSKKSCHHLAVQWKNCLAGHLPSLNAWPWIKAPSLSVLFFQFYMPACVLEKSRCPEQGPQKCAWPLISSQTWVDVLGFLWKPCRKAWNIISIIPCWNELIETEVNNSKKVLYLVVSLSIFFNKYWIMKKFRLLILKWLLKWSFLIESFQ